MENWQDRFDKQFGKDGPEQDSDSIGRGAGCDDCYGNIMLRAEHKQFITDLLEQEKNKWLEALPKEKERCVSDLHKSQLLRDDYFKDLAWLELLPPNN